MALATAKTMAAQVRQPGGMTLETIEQVTADRAQAVKDRMAASRDRTARLKQTAEELQEAIKNRDIDRVAILSADFKSASEGLNANTKDLAEVMMGLGQGFKDIGIALEEVQQRSADEQKLVDDANALLGQMEGRVLAANTQLATAEKSFDFLGSRQRAITAANEAIAIATRQRDDAKVGITTAEQLADQRMRDRLQNMSLDQSLSRLQSITQQVIQIASDRISEIEGNIVAIENGRIQTVEDLKSYTKDIEEGDSKIAAVKAAIQNLQDQQRELQENSSEWTNIQGQIKEKQNELAQVEADRNKSFSLAQDGQRFLEAYAVQEASQRGLLQFHQIWISTLETGVQQRSVLYESHLGVIRAAGDQKAMGMVDAVAVETDERITSDAAKHLGAIQNQMADKLSSMPDQVRRMREITSAMAEGKAAFDQKMDELRTIFNKNFDTPQGYDDSGTYMPQSEPTAPSQSAA